MMNITTARQKYDNETKWYTFYNETKRRDSSRKSRIFSKSCKRVTLAQPSSAIPQLVSSPDRSLRSLRSPMHRSPALDSLNEEEQEILSQSSSDASASTKNSTLLDLAPPATVPVMMATSVSVEEELSCAASCDPSKASFPSILSSPPGIDICQTTTDMTNATKASPCKSSAEASPDDAERSLGMPNLVKSMNSIEDIDKSLRANCQDEATPNRDASSFSSSELSKEDNGILEVSNSEHVLVDMHAPTKAQQHVKRLVVSLLQASTIAGYRLIVFLTEPNVATAMLVSNVVLLLLIVFS